jgi:hypothetical protein
MVYKLFKICMTYWIVVRYSFPVVLFQELIGLKDIDTCSYISVAPFSFYAMECRYLRDSSNILDVYFLQNLLGDIASGQVIDVFL